VSRRPKAAPVRRTKAQPAGQPKTQPKAQPKSQAKAQPKAQPKSQAKARPGSPPKARFGRPVRTPRAAKPARPAPPPVLQRRSFGSLLARGVVLTVAIVGMVAFAVALAKVTLVPSPSSDALIHTNLRPGASIRAYLDQPALRDSVKQIGGNILLGVPFGILLPVLFPRARGFVRVGVLTALVMVLVEAAQGAIVEGRAFDIDDVILNTLGALIGYLLLGMRLGRALHPRRRHWWHRFRTAPAPAAASGRSTSAGRSGRSARSDRSARAASAESGGGWFRQGRRPVRRRP
jgi:hypothetical protein